MLSIITIVTVIPYLAVLSLSIYSVRTVYSSGLTGRVRVHSAELRSPAVPNGATDPPRPGPASSRTVCLRLTSRTLHSVFALSSKTVFALSSFYINFLLNFNLPSRIFLRTHRSLFLCVSLSLTLLHYHPTYIVYLFTIDKTLHMPHLTTHTANLTL